MLCLGALSSSSSWAHTWGERRASGRGEQVGGDDAGARGLPGRARHGSVGQRGIEQRALVGGPVGRHARVHVLLERGDGVPLRLLRTCACKVVLEGATCGATLLPICRQRRLPTCCWHAYYGVQGSTVNTVGMTLVTSGSQLPAYQSLPGQHLQTYWQVQHTGRCAESDLDGGQGGHVMQLVQILLHAHRLHRKHILICRAQFEGLQRPRQPAAIASEQQAPVRVIQCASEHGEQQLIVRLLHAQVLPCMLPCSLVRSVANSKSYRFKAAGDPMTQNELL